MKTNLTINLLALCAGCLLFAGSAMASPCSTQIDALSKLIAQTSIATGPTGTDATDQTDADSAASVSPSGAPAAGSAPSPAEMSLQQARQYDQAGDQASCLDAVGKAHEALGGN